MHDFLCSSLALKPHVEMMASQVGRATMILGLCVDQTPCPLAFDIRSEGETNFCCEASEVLGWCIRIPGGRVQVSVSPSPAGGPGAH